MIDFKAIVFVDLVQLLDIIGKSYHEQQMKHYDGTHFLNQVLNRERPIMQPNMHPDIQQTRASKTAEGVAARTLFLWEGVTYFLEKESIIQTLRFIVKNSAPQSKVAFDYYPPEVVNGTSTDKTGKEMYKLVNKLGEPYKFGMKVYDTEPFLKTLGFTKINKLSTDQIKESYFHGNNKKRKVTHNFNFVCATT